MWAWMGWRVCTAHRNGGSRRSCEQWIEGRDPPTTRPPYRRGWGGEKFTEWAAATRAKPGEFVMVADQGRHEFLTSQPVAALPLDPDTHRRLYQLGLKTLGNLTALPEAAGA